MYIINNHTHIRLITCASKPLSVRGGEAEAQAKTQKPPIIDRERPSQLRHLSKPKLMPYNACSDELHGQTQSVYPIELSEPRIPNIA